MSERLPEPGDAWLDAEGIICTMHDARDTWIANRESTAAEPSRKETSL
jgi:hypothetical protein